MKDLEALRLALREFVKERDWAQFHSPKNLVMALSVEAAELVEQFQWLTEAESDHLEPAQLQAVADEIADVQIYLVQVADRLGIDILEAATRKIVRNAEKYPTALARGRADNIPSSHPKTALTCR
jgi:dCTP diphosphatase